MRKAVPLVMDQISIESLRTFAASHNELAFAHLCTAALRSRTRQLRPVAQSVHLCHPCHRHHAPRRRHHTRGEVLAVALDPLMTSGSILPKAGWPTNDLFKVMMWAGDDAGLERAARCICCCDEHTCENCPARRWYGCRGQGSELLTALEIEGWFRSYSRTRGFTREQFFGEKTA